MPGVNILGISAFYHDSAACLVRDGEIVAAAQEERFTRLKHDARFPANAVRYCLEEGGIGGDSLDLIVFNEKPFLRFERLLETYLEFAPRGLGQFLQAIPMWLREKLWIREIIHREPGFDGTSLFTTHHESHAAAAFFPSPFQDAAILTMDAVGEWATASYGAGEGNEVHLTGELRFPHSLGMLYSAFTYFTGFSVNSDEYKVMGLAPYGEPRYRDLILSELVDLREDGSFRLNMDYFNYCTGLTMTNARFAKLFGTSPREPGSDIRQVDMDLARSVQEVAEQIVLKMARFIRDQTGKDRLVMSGGVALNSVANGKLLREGIFDEIWVQPAAGDAGSALGAALYGWHQYLGNRREADGRTDQMQGALLGPRYSDDRIEKILQQQGASFKRLSEGEMLDAVSRRIAEGYVVGWFQGRMEFGPRALGARSILADARREDMQQRINHKIKFREGFRPFAPAVLQGKAQGYFDMPVDSPYMLMVFPVRDEHLREPGEEEKALSGLEKLAVLRSDIPAVTHVDNSARVQTVDPEGNPLFASLLKRFEDVTGCPILVNTSFNVRGEPIVCSPEDALMCFMRTDMDALATGSFLLDKADQVNKENAGGWKSPDEKGDPLPGKKQLRVFGLSTGCGLVVMSLVLRWKFSTESLWGIAVAGALLAASGLFFPQYLSGFHRHWTRITGTVGRWVFAFTLGLGYFTVLVPVAIVARLAGRRVLTRGADRSMNTYWEPCDAGGKNTSERQY